MSQQNILPRIKLFLLGGTITMDSSDETEGVTPTLDAEMLCRAVPGLARIADLEARTDELLASGNLGFSHAFSLAKDIRQAARDDSADGFVIVQGTDTLEEMAFLLDCQLDIDLPVVVTGAMRSPSGSSADGPANILAAVQAAACPSVGLAGVGVVMNDDIHSSRFATKSHTGNLAAFISPNMGPLGRVVEGRVRLFCLPVQGPKLSLDEAVEIPKVALLKASFDDEGGLLDMIETSDYQGLVIESFGAGHLPEKYLSRLGRLAPKIPVILASRTGAGHVFRKTYGYAGAEIDLIKRGLIPSGLLDGLKARLFLILLLMTGASSEEIEQSFVHWDI